MHKWLHQCQLCFSRQDFVNDFVSALVSDGEALFLLDGCLSNGLVQLLLGFVLLEVEAIFELEQIWLRLVLSDCIFLLVLGQIIVKNLSVRFQAKELLFACEGRRRLLGDADVLKAGHGLLTLPLLEKVRFCS